jgi:hypothetical protein
LLPPAGADHHGISPSNFVVFGSEVLFQGFDDNGGDEQLWATDGRDRRRGRPAATQLTVLGTSEVLFAGVDFSNKHGLWATNGSPGGTSEILSTNAPGGGLNPTDLIAVNTDSWKTGKSGIFGAGSNWTASSAPTSSQEAVIAVAGTYTVSAISGATVAALDIANKTATLLVTSGATFAATSGTGPDANLGTVVVQSGGIFAPGGTFHNSGSLKAAAGGDVVLGGTMANGSAGVILASGASARVDLNGATISGGIVKAMSHGVLNVSGGRIGSGTLVETLSGGSAIVSGTVANSGTLLASALGGLIEVAGVVSGGAVTVGDGIVDVLSGGTANIAFRSNGSGGLEIADTPGNPHAFSGTVSGFGGVNHTNHKQFIDLVSVTSAAHTISFSYTSAAGSGTLTVSSGGAIVASIDLVGAPTRRVPSTSSPASAGLSRSPTLQWSTAEQWNRRLSHLWSSMVSTCRTSASAGPVRSPMRRRPTPATR